jgi:hypothetical protein
LPIVFGQYDPVLALDCGDFRLGEGRAEPVMMPRLSAGSKDLETRIALAEQVHEAPQIKKFFARDYDKVSEAV